MFRETLEEYESLARRAMAMADKLEHIGQDMALDISRWIGIYRSPAYQDNRYHVSLADQFDFIDDNSVYGLTHVCFTARGGGKRFRVLVPVEMLDTPTEDWEPFVDTPSLHNFVVKPRRVMPPCPMKEEPHG